MSQMLQVVSMLEVQIISRRFALQSKLVRGAEYSVCWVWKINRVSWAYVPQTRFYLNLSVVEYLPNF